MGYEQRRKQNPLFGEISLGWNVDAGLMQHPANMQTFNIENRNAGRSHFTLRSNRYQTRFSRRNIHLK